MISIGKSYTFSAAHRLWYTAWTEEENREEFGPCANLHGHNYKVTVELQGPLNQETGMVLNYYALDDIVKPIIEVFDHYDGDIGSVVEEYGLPTAEVLAWYFAEAVATSLPWVSAVTVQETDKTFARWER